MVARARTVSRSHGGIAIANCMPATPGRLGAPVCHPMPQAANPSSAIPANPMAETAMCEQPQPNHALSLAEAAISNHAPAMHEHPAAANPCPEPGLSCPALHANPIAEPAMPMGSEVPSVPMPSVPSVSMPDQHGPVHVPVHVPVPRVSVPEQPLGVAVRVPVPMPV